jgi:hypothetical protein
MKIQFLENHSTVSAGIGVMLPFGMTLSPFAAEVSNFLSLLARFVSSSRVTWLKLDVPHEYSMFVAGIQNLLDHH